MKRLKRTRSWIENSSGNWRMRCFRDMRFPVSTRLVIEYLTRCSYRQPCHGNLIYTSTQAGPRSFWYKLGESCHRPFESCKKWLHLSRIEHPRDQIKTRQKPIRLFAYLSENVVKFILVVLMPSSCSLTCMSESDLQSESYMWSDLNRSKMSKNRGTVVKLRYSSSFTHLNGRMSTYFSLNCQFDIYIYIYIYSRRLCFGNLNLVFPSPRKQPMVLKFTR